jgi:hypothetical protein
VIPFLYEGTHKSEVKITYAKEKSMIIEKVKLKKREKKQSSKSEKKAVKVKYLD